MKQKFIFATIVFSLGILLSSCGGATSGSGDNSHGDVVNASNYSSIHYANGNSVSKTQWLSMYDDHKLIDICARGQSYYDDKCWDNLNIDIDNMSLSVSNLDGSSEDIILNKNIDARLYNATNSKFNNNNQEDDLCLRATTEFVPDQYRYSRDHALGTIGECWYTLTYDMPWPFRPQYSTLPNSSTLSYFDIQTFLRYGDGDPYRSNDTPYKNSWWLNGTLKVNEKKLSLSSVTMSDLETALGTTLSTRFYRKDNGNYSVVFTFDKDYSSPYLSITSAVIDKVDQSKKNIMRPIDITFLSNLN